MIYLFHIRKHGFLVIPILVFALLSSGCIERKPERQAEQESPVSTELLEMVTEGQLLAAQTSPDSARLESVFREHRQRVLQLLAGALVEEGIDLYRAALILQGSDQSDICLLAHYLALESFRKGQSKGRFLAATALDRSLVLRQLPQRFGTQMFIDKLGRVRLYPIDSLISDSERAAWDVPPLESFDLDGERRK